MSVTAPGQASVTNSATALVGCELPDILIPNGKQDETRGIWMEIKQSWKLNIPSHGTGMAFLLTLVSMMSYERGKWKSINKGHGLKKLDACNNFNLHVSMWEIFPNGSSVLPYRVMHR